MKLKNIFLIILAFGLVFVSSSKAQDLKEKAQSSTGDEVKEGTRIVIATSGPAKFNSYWLDSPPRLVVEFQTANIISKLDNELIINQGAIKRIQTEYFKEGQNKSLKSLTFELLEKSPYRIWQEADAIILDIQTSKEQSLFPEKGREVFTKSENKDAVIKRLEAMDAAIRKVISKRHPPSQVSKTTTAKSSQVRGKTKMGILFWFIGLGLISGLGFLFWRRYNLILDKNLAEGEIAELKTELEEKNKLLEQEEIIRKTVENTSLTMDKELRQLKQELQEKEELLEQEKRVVKTKEDELSQKEKELQQLKNFSESLKESRAKNELPPEEPLIIEERKEGEAVEEESLTLEKAMVEKQLLEIKRQYPRLDLSRDYNRTIIIRVDSQDKSKSIKSFVNDISIGGLCFETRKEFKEGDKINLRLFFFGDNVPMMRIEGKIVWKKAVPPVNYYGVLFISQNEEQKTELNRYIESKIKKG